MRAVLTKIIIRREKKPDKAGALYLPGQHTEIPNEGTVVSVGPDVTLPVKVGDMVVFQWCEGEWLWDDDAAGYLFVLDEANLLCVKDPK